MKSKFIFKCLLCLLVILPLQLNAATYFVASQETPWKDSGSVDRIFVRSLWAPAPSVFDWDRDGDLDLIIGGDIDGSLHYFENDGSDNFIETENFLAIAVSDSSATPVATLWSSDQDMDGHLDGDTNYDGVDEGIDLIVGNSTGDIYFYERTSEDDDDIFAPHSNFGAIDVGAWATPSVTDWNDDGYPDLIIGSSNGTLNYYQNTSNDRFTQTANWKSIDVGDYSAPFVADLSGDGDLDVIVGEGDGTIHYFSNNGSGTLTETSLFSSIDVGEHSIPVLVDWDGDGYNDLMVGDDSGYISLYYQDHDNDSFVGTEDCDSHDAQINIGENEICDDADNNCDGQIDEVGAVDGNTYYADIDADGFGDPTNAILACGETPPEGYVVNDTDCNDGSVNAFPGNVEVCDSIDNNCDGTADESTAVDAVTWYEDNDSDGYGDEDESILACNALEQYVTNNTDCNDDSASAYPDNSEVCDGVDNNCDGAVDENSAIDATTWYYDADDDNFGDASITTTACVAPAHFISDNTDCDDVNSALHTDCPVAVEALTIEDGGVETGTDTAEVVVDSDEEELDTTQNEGVANEDATSNSGCSLQATANITHSQTVLKIFLSAVVLLILLRCKNANTQLPNT